jgi:hypothetical protein
LLVLLAGCDLAFGVSGKPEPCELAAFDHAARTEIVEADDFSVDWDQTIAVVTARGFAQQLALPAGEPQPIDLGVYAIMSLGLTPEADALFYTAAIEPPVLKGALRNDTLWRLDAEVPRGTYAGTPSADLFGPRRVFVRMRANDPTVQEFIDDNGRWVAAGEPLPAGGVDAPNLTPNGLTIVYSELDPSGESVVFAQSRASVDEPFGDKQQLFAGPIRRPQLCGQCKHLYAIVQTETASVLARFDR